MIQRDLILTVNNTTATLNEPLQIYQHDRGITLKIKVLKYKFSFDKLVQQDMVVDSSIISARALVLKPDGKTAFECPRHLIEDDCVIVNLTLDWTDELIEIGKYKLQLQLYGSDYINERVTLPPVEFTVAKPIGYVQEEGLPLYATADASLMDASILADAIDDTDLPEDDLENNIYNKNVWESGELISSTKLNKVEDAIEYLVQSNDEGTIFTPSVDEDGNLSWTNNSGLENPTTVNIMGPQGFRGLQGEQGPQGPQGEPGVDGTVSFDELTDVQIAMLKGEKGDTGDPLTYDDLTDEDKADLTQGFITCSDNITRIEVVTEYPAVEEEGVLYIRVRG